jgi:ribulose bisphosphate carboxylase small subunit
MAIRICFIPHVALYERINVAPKSALMAVKEALRAKDVEYVRNWGSPEGRRLGVVSAIVDVVDADKVMELSNVFSEVGPYWTSQYPD